MLDLFGFNNASAVSARVARLEGTVRRQQGVIVELCARLGIEPPVLDVTQTLDEEELRLLREGQKIAAIKHHRQRTGSGLREAKETVERG